MLKARADEGAALKRMRLHLGLTQTQASKLTGGGPNAFSRYETGKAKPAPAVMNLFLVLSKRPDLLRELPALQDARRKPRGAPARLHHS